MSPGVHLVDRQFHYAAACTASPITTPHPKCKKGKRKKGRTSPATLTHRTSSLVSARVEAGLVECATQLSLHSSILSKDEEKDKGKEAQGRVGSARGGIDPTATVQSSGEGDPSLDQGGQRSPREVDPDNLPHRLYIRLSFVGG
jgi:hypothetical protein